LSGHRMSDTNPRRSTLESAHNRRNMSAGFIRSFGFGSRRGMLTAAEPGRSTLGGEHNRGNVSAGFIRNFGDGLSRRRLSVAEARRSTLGSEHNRENMSAGFIRSFGFGSRRRPLTAAEPPRSTVGREHSRESPSAAFVRRDGTVRQGTYDLSRSHEAHALRSHHRGEARRCSSNRLARAGRSMSEAQRLTHANLATLGQDLVKILRRQKLGPGAPARPRTRDWCPRRPVRRIGRSDEWH
jgi:hypothetical protein